MPNLYVIVDSRGHAYGWDEDAETAWDIAAAEAQDEPPVGPLHMEEMDTDTHHVGWVCDPGSTVPYLGIAEGPDPDKEGL